MIDNDRLVAGRYRLIVRLGSGGMGVVWQAYDERLHRTVAVKKLMMPSELTGPQTEEANRRAMREGRIAARLQHPNSIVVYDVTEEGGQPYLIMEYLPSKSLSDVLAERGSIPPLEVAEIGRQVADALASAHAAGVVHRDVKPGNILLGHDGTVKITDFGISRAVEDVSGTTTGIIAGTPAYLSPEVAKGGRATFASDVFSLGATMYTAIEGVAPFGSSDNAMALLYRVASGEIRQPAQAGPMTDLLMQLLHPDPGQRPTMSQVSDALAAIAAGRAWDGGPTAILAPQLNREPEPPVATAVAEPQTLRTERPVMLPPVEVDHAPAPAPEVVETAPPAVAAGPRRRRPAALAAVLIAILALVGVVLLMLFDRDPSAGTAAAPTSTTEPGVPPGILPQQPQTGASAQPATTTPPPQPTTTAPAPAAPSTNPPAAPTQNPAPSGQTAQAALIDYYALMPGNLQEGWTRLTPRYQQSPAGGFTGYSNFWNQMSSVRVTDVVTRQTNVVEATVQYTFKTGKVVRERHRYVLVNQNGRWLIDQSSVLSSVTL